MKTSPEWAESVSSKIWSAPMSTDAHERHHMDVEWESRRGLHGLLVELWQGIRGFTKRLRGYTKLKQR